MNSRSRRYYESRKAERGTKKGSSTGAGYDEQNETTYQEPKENPAPQKSDDQPGESTRAEQDDTIGTGSNEENRGD